MTYPRVPLDVSDDEMQLVLAASGEINDGSHRIAEIYLVRKGGGMLVKIDGKKENRFFIPLEAMVDFAVDMIVPIFLAEETPPVAEAAPVQADAVPAPTGEAAPIDEFFVAEDGPQG